MSSFNSNTDGLPGGWSYTSIGEVATVAAGGTPSRQSAEYWGGHIPWVTTRQIDFGIIIQPEEFITEEGFRNSAARRFKKGSILLALIGQGTTRGKVAVLGIDATINQNCVALCVHDNVNSSFIYQYLAHKYEKIRGLSNSGGQSSLNTSIVKGIQVFLPPPFEQDAIALIGDTWDRGIRQLSNLIAAKLRFKQGLMQQLLTGRRRFPKFGSPSLSSHELPLGWNRIKAGELFTNHSQKRNGDEVLLSVTQEHGVIPRSMLEGRVVMPESGTDGYKLVEPGDFVISLRSFQGGLEYSEYRGLVSPAYTVLKSRRPIHSRFFRHYLKSFDFIQRLAIAVIGIRDGKQISFEDFREVRLPYPPLIEQERIASAIDTINREINILRRQLDALKTQKKGLMQKLLTGQVRVKLPDPV